MLYSYILIPCFSIYITSFIKRGNQNVEAWEDAEWRPHQKSLRCKLKCIFRPYPAGARAEFEATPLHLTTLRSFQCWLSLYRLLPQIIGSIFSKRSYVVGPNYLHNTMEYITVQKRLQIPCISEVTLNIHTASTLTYII